MMSHPFQGGVGDRDESSLSRRGWRDRNESSKGGVSQGRRGGGTPITARGGGWEADYFNVTLQNTLSPRSVLI